MRSWIHSPREKASRRATNFDLGINPPPGGRWRSILGITWRVSTPFLASLHPVGNFPKWLLPMPVSTHRTGFCWHCGWNTSLQGTRIIPRNPNLQLLPPRSGNDLHATSRRPCHHHLAKWPTSPAERGLGCQCAFFLDNGSSSESNLVRSCSTIVQHEDFWIVPSWLSVIRDHPHKSCSTRTRDHPTPHLGPLCRAGKDLGGSPLPSNAPRTVLSVPQTWFTTRDGTNMADASKHLRLVSAASIIEHILADLDFPSIKIKSSPLDVCSKALRNSQFLSDNHPCKS